MSGRLKWMLAGAFLLVFAAGVMTGSLAGARYLRKQIKHRVMLHPGGGALGERMQEHLRDELGLTPEQAAALRPILEQTGANLQSIRRETTERVRETMDTAAEQMAPHLSPEQQQKLQELRDRHKGQLRMRHRHRKEWRRQHRAPPVEPSGH